MRKIRYFMIFPTKPSKLFHTEIIIKSKPQGSVNSQGRFFLFQALTSFQESSETQTSIAPVSKKIFTGNENDKTAISFWRLYKDLCKVQQKTDFLEYTVPGPNTFPSKRIPCIHTFEQSMNKRTKINVRIQMRQLHKLDFLIVNLFFFFPLLMLHFRNVLFHFWELSG